MKKQAVILTLSLVALFGCTSTQTIDTSINTNQELILSDLSKVKWNTVSSKANLAFRIDENTPMLDSDNISSRIVGISIKSSGKPIEFTMTSEMRDLRVFQPNLAVYDQNNSLIRSFDSSFFPYDRRDFVKGEVLEGSVVITPKPDTTELRFLIYTSQEDLGKETTIIHPAKAFAISKRTVEPNIPDPVVQHVDIGEIKVAIREAASSIFDFSESKSPSAPNIPSDSLAVVPVQSETKTYYISAIQKAVAEDNIPKALSLLDEAKALNVEGAQETFVKAINSRK
jgi:maltose operon protein